MNIRVDLTTPIKDGTEVVFRSPVDCSQITGLIVYFKENGNTASQEFALADAHGNNVGDIDHLFAENVVVKVILDVSHGMAFVQNADTNAYLEGRFDGIVNSLCPPINETGTVVQCEPVEGYPLKIVSDNKQLRFFVCGKNLYSAGEYPLSVKGYIQHANGNTKEGETSAYLFTEGFIPISHLRGKPIAIRKAPAKTNGVSTGAGIAFYTESKGYISGTNKETVDVPNDAVYMRFTINKGNVDEAQIEIGSAVTDFEEYIGTTVEAYHETNIPAHKGINTVYALDQNDIAANVEVTGRANPLAILEKLTNAIISLGGNV